jgi:hypothetical protein
MNNPYSYRVLPRPEFTVGDVFGQNDIKKLTSVNLFVFCHFISASVCLHHRDSPVIVVQYMRSCHVVIVCLNDCVIYVSGTSGFGKTTKMLYQIRIALQL